MSSFCNPLKTYNKYAKDIVEEKIIACESIKLACQRYLSWFDRDDIYFDESDVDKKIRFVSKMKHSTGVHAGKSFELLPWQQFAFAGIFGWKWKDSGYRVTKKALMFVARKNGKTALAAALGLCCAVADNEQGAEIDMIANSTKQAEICYEQTKNFAESIDPKGKLFKRFRRDIRIPATKGVIQVHSSDSMGNDGFNASTTILDEFHSQKDWGLYNVFISSMGMRTQPLMLIITTSGFLVGETYPCYSMYMTCKQILRNVKQDDTMFSLLYELDEEDDWKDEKNWIKCSPSLGTTVRYEYMREQITDAINNTSLEVGVKTKNLNMWCQAANIWISRDYIQKVMEPVNLEDYRDEIAFGGCDLSVVCDLTAHSVCIPPNPDRKLNGDKFIFKSWLYIPDDAVQNSPNKNYYQEWIRRGWAIKTSGNVVDYEHILKDQLEVSRTISFVDYGYDAYNASSWAISAENAGLPLCIYGQSIGHFNGPTKFFEMLVRSGKCIIDTNPAVDWCFGNVELMIDHNENTKPTKANGEKNNKIDPVISMLEALGCYLNSRYYSPEAWVLS
jgi:phage terminase large subunit-like protein